MTHHDDLKKTRILILPASQDMVEVLNIPGPFDLNQKDPGGVPGIVLCAVLENLASLLKKIVVRPQIKLTAEDQRLAADTLNYVLGVVPGGQAYTPRAGSLEGPLEIAVTRAWGDEISSSELTNEDLSELVIYIFRYELAERRSREGGAPRPDD